jgi:hypothetical protein
VPATDPRLIERIEAQRERQDDEQHSWWQPIHYMLDEEQRAVTVTTGANEILDELPDHSRLCQDVLVSNIRHRIFPFAVSTTGRVFNSVSGLKRELRAALRLAGEPLGSVDIVNAQPALLAMLLLQKTNPKVVKVAETYKHTPCSPTLPCPCLPGGPDARAFADSALSGGLYELLIATSGLTRDEVKVGFLRDVLAKKGRYPSVVESAFRDAFPSVLRTIRSVNSTDHGTLIRMLQKAEAWLVLGQVAPRLLGRVPIVTLHDAIYSRRREVGSVADSFRDAFRDIGVSMGLKVEG